MKYYKVLHDDGHCYWGGRGSWPLDGSWIEVAGKLVACENALHVCTLEQLRGWVGPAIFEVEVEGETHNAGDKTICRKARVVRKLPWNDRTAREFAADCAEHVLSIFEAEYPNNARPRQAVDAARRYARGGLTKAELTRAADAADAAAYAAYATYAADAARAAARAARAAADAAAAAASYAAYAAADAADAEKKWQTERLFHYLNGAN